MMVYPKALPEHNNQLPLSVGEQNARWDFNLFCMCLRATPTTNFLTMFRQSDQHFMTASKIKTLSMNNALMNDVLSQEQFLKVQIESRVEIA